jgi:thioredoxin-related protein
VPFTILPTIRLLSLVLLSLLLLAQGVQADQGADLNFDDRPLDEPLTHPDWFKLSFLDLQEDLQDAARAGKRGVILYFGQKYCAYCKALLEHNFGKADIRRYTREHFDVLGIDIHGDRSVTDLEGREWTERSFSSELGTVFTPTLLFLDTEGREVLRLPGYYPPYTFRAALEYVADGHYRQEDFRNYLARAEVPLVFEAGGLNHQDFFSPPPHALDRSRWPASRPLVVFFEQGDCHACDILHTGPLEQAAIRERLQRMDTVQLDLWGNTPVITPGGERTTDGAWATELGLFYAPTLLFFDEQGREIIRVDSVTHLLRLRSVLDYILSGDYREQPDYQRWRGRH